MRLTRRGLGAATLVAVARPAAWAAGTDPAAPRRDGAPPLADDAARSGRWSAARPMPTPRTEVAAALVADRLYVAGGFAEDGRPTALVEAFDFGTGAHEVLVLT